MKSLKILQLTADYPPQPLWGMGWHVYFLAQTLKKRGFEVFVATAHKSFNLHENIISTSIIEDLEGLSSDDYEIFNDFNKFNQWQIQLADRVIKSNINFQVIHCHNWMSWLTARHLQKQNYNIKIVVTFHFLQKQYELMNDNPILDYHSNIIDIENEIIKTTDQIIVVSDFHYNLLKSKYKISVDNKKISIVNNGVDFLPMGYELILAQRKKNQYLDFIFVGRIEADKGIVQTLKAFQALARSNVNLRLHVVGDGPLLSSLKKEFFSEQIIFHGFVERESLKELLIKSSIFCLPSSSEALPTTVIEAMLFGVVPIFSQGVTVPYLFDDGIHGLKVELFLKDGIYNPIEEDIQLNMKRLIENHDLLNQLSRNAYNYAIKKFTANIMTDNILKIYNKL